MAVTLNHTIVHVHDKEKSSRFVAEILGLPAPTRFGAFWVVQLANGVSLDFLDAEGPVATQHYAFLISEPEFDAIFERIGDRGLAHWADPHRTKRGEIN